MIFSIIFFAFIFFPINSDNNNQQYDHTNQNEKIIVITPKNSVLSNPNFSENQLLLYFESDFDKLYNVIRLYSGGYEGKDINEGLWFNFIRIGAGLVFIITFILVLEYVLPTKISVMVKTYMPFARYYVIFGAGNKGISKINNLIETKKGKPEDIIVVEKDITNDNVVSLRERGILVIPGDGRQEDILSRIKIYKAKSIYICVNDDSSAISIISKIVTSFEQNQNKILKRKPCQCIVFLTNSEISLGSKRLLTSKDYLPLKIDIYNEDYIIGNYLYKAYKKQLGTKVRANNDTSNRININIMELDIIGVSPIIDYFLILFIYDLNLHYKDNNKDEQLVKITIIDPRAKRYLHELKKVYPRIRNYREINAVSLQKDMDNYYDGLHRSKVQNRLILICQQNDLLAFEKSFYIDRLLRENTTIEEKIPIIIKTEEDTSVYNLFKEDKNNVTSTVFIIPINKILIEQQYHELDISSGLLKWARSLEEIIDAHPFFTNRKYDITDPYQDECK
jgi:voltage-gated potassium channel Kch